MVARERVTRMKVTKTTEIVLDGKKYLLEEGDDITLNEGLISRSLLAVINKFIPIDIFNKINPQSQALFADVIKDPEKAKMLGKLYKEKPEFLKIFT